MKRFVCLALIALLLFTACSANTASQAGTAGASSGEAPAAAGSDVTLNYVTWRTDDQAVLDTLHAKFKEETGITVNVEYNAGGDEHYSMCSTRMAAGTLDMFAIDSGGEVWPFISSGDLYEIPADTAWLAGYEESAIASGTYDGKIYSIPQCTSTMVFYYDKAYFNELNIPQPETWDDFLAACETVKNAGDRAPIVIGSIRPWVATYLFYILYPTVAPADSPNYLAQLESGEITLADPTLQKVAGYVSELYNSGYIMEGSDGVDPNVAPSMVIGDNAAISVEGSWRLFAYNEPDFELGMFIPTVDENAYCVWPNQQNVICEKSPNKDAVMQYFEFLARPENAAYYCNETMQIPVVKGVESTDANTAELLKIMADKEAVMSPKMDSTNNEILSYYWDFCTGVLAGQDPASYAQEIQANIDAARA